MSLNTYKHAYRRDMEEKRLECAKTLCSLVRPLWMTTSHSSIKTKTKPTKKTEKHWRFRCAECTRLTSSCTVWGRSFCFVHLYPWSPPISTKANIISNPSSNTGQRKGMQSQVSTWTFHERRHTEPVHPSRDFGEFTQTNGHFWWNLVLVSPSSHQTFITQFLLLTRMAHVFLPWFGIWSLFFFLGGSLTNVFSSDSDYFVVVVRR